MQGAPPKLEIWAVDPLEKVFGDSEPSGSTTARIDVARGEVATLQFVIRSSEPIRGLNARLKSLPFVLHQEGEPRPPDLKPERPRFVGYVPVDRPIQTPPRDQLRKLPAEFPDPLLEVDRIDVPENTAQPIWVSIPVPLDATPGTYEGSPTTICGRFAGASAPYGFASSTAASIRIHPATVGRSRLWVTNWFSMRPHHMEIDAKPDSEEYWALLRRFARNMASHRENVALISPLSLAEFRVGPAGRLEIDFSRFDRWVEIFRDDGVIGRIEGGHIGGRNERGWETSSSTRPHEVPIWS